MPSRRVAAVSSAPVRSLHRGALHAVLRLPDDVDGVRRARGEALGEQVAGALGLGARRRVVGGELARERAGGGEGGDQRHDPGQQHEPPAAEREVGEAAEPAGALRCVLYVTHVYLANVASETLDAARVAAQS